LQKGCIYDNGKEREIKTSLPCYVTAVYDVYGFQSVLLFSNAAITHNEIIESIANVDRFSCSDCNDFV